MDIIVFMLLHQPWPSSGQIAFGQPKRLHAKRSLVDRCGKHLFKNHFDELQLHLVMFWSFQMVFPLLKSPERPLQYWEKKDLSEVLTSIFVRSVHIHSKHLPTESQIMILLHY